MHSFRFTTKTRGARTKTGTFINVLGDSRDEPANVGALQNRSFSVWFTWGPKADLGQKLD